MGYPVLADHFFQDKRPSREFFARMKERGPWSPSLLPIYEWQGVLFVAFSNLDDVAISPDWCPVQANPSLMMELYFELTTESSVVQDALALELLADEAPVTPPEAPGDEEFGGLDLTSEDEKRSPQMSDKTQAVDLTALTKAPTAESETVSAITAPPANPMMPPPPPSLEFDDLSFTPNPASSPTPPPPPVKTVSAEVVSPVPASPAALARKPAAAMTKEQSTAAPASADSPLEAELWSKMSQHFEASMICLFQKGQILPVKWSPNLKHEPTQMKSYSTLKASPFRIVARTQKSYHGYLVPNEISDTFFHDWTQGTYPEHLTMSPIVSGELVVGFLMGWGKTTAGTKDALTLCETTAKQISPLALKYAETNRVAA